MEVIAFISFFLGVSWDFFTEITVPGFGFSFAALFVGLFLAALSLRLLSAMIGVGFHSSMLLPFVSKKDRSGGNGHE